MRTGVSHTTIARIEKGEVTASFHRTIKLIADGYGVSMDYVLSGKLPPQDVETQFRLHGVDGEVVRSIPREKVQEYIKILYKAMRADIDPNMLDTAVDLLTIGNGRMSASTGLRTPTRAVAEAGGGRFN